MALLVKNGNYMSASVLRITLKNGYVWRITDYSEDIGDYKQFDFTRSPIKRTLQLVSDVLNITFGDTTQDVVPQITLAKVFRLGLLDKAKVELSRVLWRGESNPLYIKLFKGYINDSPERDDSELNITAHNYIHLFNQQFPRETYTMLCNNEFKDYRCKYSVTDISYDLEFATSNRGILLGWDTTKASDLIGGYIEFSTVTDFVFKEKKMLIFDTFVSGGKVYLKFAENFPKGFNILGVVVRRGCDKTQQTCKSLNNFNNFRGFVKIPRPEVML